MTRLDPHQPVPQTSGPPPTPRRKLRAWVVLILVWVVGLFVWGLYLLGIGAVLMKWLTP